MKKIGLAKLNIWISGMDDICKVSDNRPWYVTIFDCNGDVLQWCGKKYALMPAKCGHLEVMVPPGCYYIKAVWNYRRIMPTVFKVNHFTDAAIVQAICDETTCVKLFNPSAHRCGRIFIKAVRDLREQKVVQTDIADRAIEAINGVLDQLPKPEKEFELGKDELFDKLLSEQKE